MKANNKKLILLILIVCLLFAVSIIATYYSKLTSSSSIQSNNTLKSLNYCLPHHLKPILYDVTLKIDLKIFKFEGAVNISFKCLNTTNRIVIHLRDLDVLNNTIRVYSHSDLNDVFLFNKWIYDYETELMTIPMFTYCRNNSMYSLAFNYSGNISSNQIGLYKSSYLDTRNQSKYFVATKFEPFYARRVIPCFDEPNMKAEFRLKIIRHKMYHSSFSNVRLNYSESIKESSWSIDHYELSQPMSTYLISILVSDLNTIRTKSTKLNCSIQIVYNSLTSQQIKFSLGKIDQILNFVSGLFNFTYPYNTTPLISIPSNDSGILLNSGVINKIYKRERSYQFNRLISLQDNRRLITSVLAHELSHQWFGYLITPEWWSDLWINEGFVTYIEYLVFNHTNPELNEMDNLFIDLLQLMVKESIYVNISPISNSNVYSQTQIKNQFNSINYEKASALIHFMVSFIQFESFQQATNVCLNSRKLSNLDKNMLWVFLTNVTNYNIKPIMDSWTLNRGYPIIDLRTTELNNNKIQIKLSQKRFMLNSSVFDDSIWYVPIQITTQSKTYEPIWLNQSEQIIELNDTLTNQWLIGYYKSGYYRINYDVNNWLLLIDQLKLDHNVISPLNRAKLIDDSFNLARAQLIDLSVYLKLIEYLVKEQNSLPIETSLFTFDYIANMISDDYHLLKSYKEWCISLLKHLNDGNEFQINSSSSLTIIDLNLKVIQLLCEYGEPDCIKQSLLTYKNWLTNNQTLPFLFESIVLNTFIQNSNDPNDWFNLLDIYFKEKQFYLLNALAYTKNYNLLKTFLNKICLGFFEITSANEIILLNSIARNKIGTYLVLDYLNDYWFISYQKYGNHLIELVELIMNRFNTESDLARKSFFFSDKSQLNTINSYLTSVIELNIKWKNANFLPIQSYLVNKKL